MRPHRRILLVDDETAARKLYRSHLTQAGYQVVEADSGIAAVEAAEREAFDAVVMDLNMPGLDGWMALSLIKARRPQLPVIILTGAEGSDLELKAKHSGAAGLLTKPCAPELLSRTVARAVKAE
jgi:two-component system response regulator FlrC